MIEEETTGDVEALISDVENLEGEIKQLKVNQQSARDKYNASKAEGKLVEDQLAEVSAKIHDMQSSIDPLRVGDAKFSAVYNKWIYQGIFLDTF